MRLHFIQQTLLPQPILSNVRSCVLMCAREIHTYPLFVVAPGTQVVDFAPIFFCVRLLRALHITRLCLSAVYGELCGTTELQCVRALSLSHIAQHVQGTIIRSHRLRTFHLRGGLTTVWPHTAGKTFSAFPSNTLPVTILPVIPSSSMPSLANAARHVCMHVSWYVCIYVCMQVSMYIRTYLCMHA